MKHASSVFFKTLSSGCTNLDETRYSGWAPTEQPLVRPRTFFYVASARPLHVAWTKIHPTPNHRRCVPNHFHDVKRLHETV
ncbi:hypothetical protein PFISCL1PPCAC_18071 [Pristionchus fissidentatus]|uniref:THAP-type domain-containing protein n=1 Tax=Pristionchus fissidentatus TaxID=1538716 RepID=A0AAV5W7T8_9BILA|nr:hypothetical protein PFISCL1PPCAC_18071 [Pristionchus fissidentatus]